MLHFAIAVAAIVRRPDVADSSYFVADDTYPAVFALPTKGNCAATLIDSQHALTAAHCMDGSSIVTAPFDVQIDGGTETVSAIYKNPCFSFANDGPNGADLAVLRLSAPVSGVTPVPLYSASDEVGQTFTLIGWGNHGAGGGAAPGNCEDTSCAQLRAGTNVFTNVRDNTLEYVFDAPSSALPLEAIATAGDSGGPHRICGWC